MGVPDQRQSTAASTDRRKSRAWRVARTSAGLALVASGSTLLLLPGPGLLLIGAGIALIPGGPRKLVRARAVVAPRARALVVQVSRWMERRQPA